MPPSSSFNFSVRISNTKLTYIGYNLYTFMDLLADVGGTLVILSLVGYMITAAYASFSFANSLIN